MANTDIHYKYRFQNYITLQVFAIVYQMEVL